MAGYTLRLSDSELGRYQWMAQRAKVLEADLWQLAGIAPGARVADIGCGPAAVLSLVAEVVSPDGSVTGVDADEDAVAVAGAMIATVGAGNARVQQGQADDTGLETGSFDVVMMRHVLAHNGGKEQRIVDHLAALARPGGAVYLVDVDLTAMRLYPSVDGLDDVIDSYAEFHRLRGNDPQVGLRLQHLCREAGLEVEAFRGWFDIAELPVGLRPPAWAARDAMLEAGVVTTETVQRWGDAFERLDEGTERPSIFPPLFAAVGRKPTG